MTAYKIDYSELQSAESNVRKAKEELYDCMDFLSVKVMGKLNSLPGSDEFGNIASVQSSINTKVGAMRSKQDVLEDFVYDVDHFSSTAEDADQRVADKISELTEPHKAAWSFTEAWRSVTGFFYNVFCVDIPNFLGDRSPFFEGIIEFLREKANSVSHWLDDIVNYFQHGEGQYVHNVVSSGLALVGGVITAVAAVVGALANSLILLAATAVLLGVVFVAYLAANCVVTAVNNYEAYQYANDGRKDLAHYYSGTESFVDWAEKKDFGDASENIKYDTAMSIFETVGKAAEIGLVLVNIANSALALGNVYSGPDRKKVVGKDYRIANIKENRDYELINIFKKSGVKDDSVITKDRKIQEYEIDLLEFIFNTETNDVRDLVGDDTLKRYKVVKKGVDWLVGSLSGEKSGYGKLAETMDELYADYSAKGVLDVVTEAFSLLNVGPAHYADEHFNPSATLIQKVFELLLPEPA